MLSEIWHHEGVRNICAEIKISCSKIVWLTVCFSRRYRGPGQPAHSAHRLPAVGRSGRLHRRAAARALSAALHRQHGRQRPAGQYHREKNHLNPDRKRKSKGLLTEKQNVSVSVSPTPADVICRYVWWFDHFLINNKLSLQVVSRCYQLLTSVFQAPPSVAVPYIQALGPPLVRFLQVLNSLVSPECLSMFQCFTGRCCCFSLQQEKLKCNPDKI